MAIPLPARPSLEWLRKAAKDHLAELRVTSPQASLAQAQRAIAGRYGFPSWRALKGHVDGLTGKRASLDDSLVGRFLERVGVGDLDALRAAITADPGIVNAVGPHPFWGGRPQALHVAVESRRREVLDLLLASGADVNGRNDGYDHWSPFALAIDRNQPDLQRALLAAGARVGLLEALLLGDQAALAALVRRDPSVARSEAVLMGAVDFGHHDLAQWLLAHGADPNARSALGSRGTALHSAAWEGDLPMARLLVAAGADVRARDAEHDNTPAGWARVASKVTNNPRCADVAGYLDSLAP